MRVSFRYTNQQDPDDSRIFSFTHPEDDWIGTAQRKGKTFYEAGLLEALQERLGASSNPNPLVFDVGAHVGNHSVFFAALCHATVIAFEPQRGLLPFLTENTRDYAVTIMGCALGQPAMGSVAMDANDEKNTGRASVRYAHVYGPRHVPCYPLDSLGLRFEPALIKIDVEGFEMDVLLGALGTIRAHQPLLAVEAQTPEEFERQRRFLEPLGYVPSKRYCSTPTYIWSQG